MSVVIPDIVTDADPALQEPCPEVEDPTAIVEVVGTLMRTLLVHEDAAGLAAPQLGIRLRVIAVRMDFEHNNQIAVLINPVIEKRSGWRMVKEGCLSIPGRTFTVQRSMLVRVAAVTVDGNSKRISAQANVLAQTLEHEIDHLDGVLISCKGVEWKPIQM